MQNYTESSKFSLHETYLSSSNDLKFFAKVTSPSPPVSSSHQCHALGRPSPDREVLPSASRLLHHLVRAENRRELRLGQGEGDVLQSILQTGLSTSREVQCLRERYLHLGAMPQGAVPSGRCEVSG